VICNDTDAVVLLLYYIGLFKEGGLQERWVQFGTGEKRRMIPLHALHFKLVEDLCHVYIKAHIMTDDYALSKMSTQHAAFTCTPTRFLSLHRHLFSLKHTSIKRNSTLSMYRQVRQANPWQLPLINLDSKSTGTLGVSKAHPALIRILYNCSGKCNSKRCSCKSSRCYASVAA